MLGSLIASLDDPAVTAGLLAALDDRPLGARLAAAAAASGRPQAEVAATSVRRFLDAASDDHWVQLIGIMNRAEDPGLAALHAILRSALPDTGRG
jgi:hypothetical protein